VACFKLPSLYLPEGTEVNRVIPQDSRSPGEI
jgi:hypothetical protein